MVKKNNIILLLVAVFMFAEFNLIWGQANPEYPDGGTGYGYGDGYGSGGGGGGSNQIFIESVGKEGAGKYDIYKSKHDDNYSVSVPKSSNLTVITTSLKDNLLEQNGELFVKLTDGSLRKVSAIYITDLKGELSPTDNTLIITNIWRLMRTGGFMAEGNDVAPNGLSYIQNFNADLDPNKIGKYTIQIEEKKYLLAYEWLAERGFSVSSRPEDIRDGKNIGDLFSEYVQSNSERSKQWIVPQEKVVIDSPVAKTEQKADEKIEETILAPVIKVAVKLSRKLADSFLPKSPRERSGFSSSYRSDSGVRELRSENNKPVVIEKIFPAGLTRNRQWSDVNTVTNDGKNFMIIARRSSDGKKVGFYLTEAQFAGLSSNPNAKTNRNPIISLAVNVKMAGDNIKISALDFIKRFSVIEKTDYAAIGKYNRIKKSNLPAVKIDELVSVDDDLNIKTQSCRTTINLSDIRRISC